MTKMEDLLHSEMVKGVALGVGVAILVPVVFMAPAPVIMPVARSAAKAGLRADERACEAVEAVVEVIADLTAEARSELREERFAQERSGRGRGGSVAIARLQARDISSEKRQSGIEVRDCASNRRTHPAARPASVSF